MDLLSNTLPHARREDDGRHQGKVETKEGLPARNGLGQPYPFGALSRVEKRVICKSRGTHRSFGGNSGDNLLLMLLTI